MTSRMNRDELGVSGHNGDRVAQMVAYIDQDAAKANPRAFGGSSTYNQELQRYTPVLPHLYVERLAARPALGHSTYFSAEVSAGVGSEQHEQGGDAQQVGDAQQRHAQVASR